MFPPGLESHTRLSWAPLGLHLVGRASDEEICYGNCASPLHVPVKTRAILVLAMCMRILYLVKSLGLNLSLSAQSYTDSGYYFSALGQNFSC